MKDEVPPTLITSHTTAVETALKEGKEIDSSKYNMENSGIAGTESKEKKEEQKEGEKKEGEKKEGEKKEGDEEKKSEDKNVSRCKRNYESIPETFLKYSEAFTMSKNEKLFSWQESTSLY